MNNKLISAVTRGILFVSIFTIFIAVVKAEGLNLLCIQKYNMVVTLKNETNLETAKDIILKIPHIRIIKITDRNKEWSKYVNKYDDLPNIQNPFKNEIFIKTNKDANINEIYNKIKEMDFIEDVKYVPDAGCTNK